MLIAAHRTACPTGFIEILRVLIFPATRFVLQLIIRETLRSPLRFKETDWTAKDRSTTNAKCFNTLDCHLRRTIKF